MAFSNTLSASWHQVTFNKRLARSSQAVSNIDRKVFIFGGELLPRQPVGNRIDVVTIDSVQEGASSNLPEPSKAPSPRVGSPSTTIGPNIYLFSGRGGLEMKPIEEDGAIWCYNTSDNEWSMITPADPSALFPVGRSYHCITSDSNDKIYLHSGCPEKGRLSDLWAFDLTNRSWAELPSAPGPARGGSSIAFLNRNLYRMNGFDGETEQGGALDVFNIRANSWSTISYNPDGLQGPEARSVSTLLPVSVQSKPHLLTMFGERDPSSLGHAGAGKMLSDVWTFDIAQSLWKRVQTDDGPVARGWFDADVMDMENGNTRVVVHGGLGEDNERLGDVWTLEISASI